MEQKNKTEWLHLRMTVEEKAALEKAFRKTTCRKLSSYARKLLFGKPVVRLYRNQSMDELMAELVLLLKELNAIGVNFNQAVHRLHTLDYLPQMQLWLEGFERDKGSFFRRVEEIKSPVERMAAVWLR